MQLTKNRSFLNISIETLDTYITLFIGNSILLYLTNYPNIVLLIKYISNVIKNSILPTNSGELNELLTYTILLGLQSAILIYVLYQLVKKASKNVILHEKDKNIGIILGMIFFLFLPTTNIYIILGLVIISVFLQKQLFNLEKQKRDLIIEMIDKVIEEKLLEEQNKQSQSKEDVQSEQIQEKLRSTWNNSNDRTTNLNNHGNNKHIRRNSIRKR